MALEELSGIFSAVDHTHLVDALGDLYSKGNVNPSNSKIFNMLKDVITKLDTPRQLVALYQLSKCLLDRYALTLVGFQIKSHLAHYDMCFRRSLCEDYVVFRSSLLSSPQHLLLIFGWADALLRTHRFDKIEIQFSLENDLLYWKNGLPLHRRKIMASKVMEVFPDALSYSLEEYAVDSVKIKLEYVGESTPRNAKPVPKLTFRLEDLHPNIECGIDSSFMQENSTVITLPCRTRIRNGKFSDFTFVLDEIRSNREFRVRLPRTRESILRAIGTETTQVEKSESNPSLASSLVIAYTGDRALDGFQRFEVHEWLTLINLLLHNHSLNVTIYGARDEEALKNLIVANTNPEIAARFRIHGVTDIRDILNNTFCALFLDVDGGLGTANLFAAKGIPIINLAKDLERDIVRVLGPGVPIKEAAILIRKMLFTPQFKEQFVESQAEKFFFTDVELCSALDAIEEHRKHV